MKYFIALVCVGFLACSLRAQVKPVDQNAFRKAAERQALETTVELVEKDLAKQYAALRKLHLKQGEALYNLGKYEEAIVAYQLALKGAVPPAENWLIFDANIRLAHVLLDYCKGQELKVLEAYSAAIKVEKTDPFHRRNVVLLRAKLYKQLGKIDEAIADLKLADDIDKQYPGLPARRTIVKVQ